jgi:hypothetical protein
MTSILVIASSLYSTVTTGNFPTSRSSQSLVTALNMFSGHTLRLTDLFKSGILGMSFNQRHIMTSMLVMALSLRTSNMSDRDIHKFGFERAQDRILTMVYRFCIKLSRINSLESDVEADDTVFC